MELLKMEPVLSALSEPPKFMIRLPILWKSGIPLRGRCQRDARSYLNTVHGLGLQASRCMSGTCREWKILWTGITVKRMKTPLSLELMPMQGISANRLRALSFMVIIISSWEVIMICMFFAVILPGEEELTAFPILKALYPEKRLHAGQMGKPFS